MARLLLALIFALFCSFEIMLSGRQPALFTFAGLMGGAWIILIIGAFLLRNADVQKACLSALSLDFIVGAVTVNLSIMIIINLAGVSAGQAFLWVCLLVFVVMIYRFLSLAVHQSSPLQASFGFHFSEMREIASITILCVVVLIWSRHQAEALVSLQQGKSLPVWIDYFLHADEIAQYSRIDGLSRGSIFFLGEPVPFYHRAIFALPAAISQLAQISAFAAATALLLPFALLVCLLGINVLGNMLAKDRFTGLLAALLLVALPDTSFYGLRNGFFGFSWLMFTSPGTGWAVGICSVSLACFGFWLKEKSVRFFVLSGLLTLALFLHRAHFFILYAPTLVLLLALSVCQKFTLKQRKITKILVIVFACLCVMAWGWPKSRDYWLTFSAVDEFLLTVHNGMEPTAVGGFYKGLIDQIGIGFAVPVGVLMVLIAAFGVWLIVFPFLLWMKRRKYELEAIDMFPLLLMGVYIVIVLFAPVTRHGDVTEYQQRVIPLAYALVITFSIVYISRLLRLSFYLNQVSLFIRAGVAVTLLLMVVVSMLGRDFARPLFAWGVNYYGLVYDRSLVRTGEYIQAHSNNYDVIAVIPTEPEAMLNDIPSELIAVSGASAFLSRAALNSRLYNRNAVMERLAILDNISGLTSQEAAFRQLGIYGVTWLVVSKNKSPSWDINCDKADYRDGAFAVYRIKSGEVIGRI